MKTKVYLVDDHKLFREGLIQLVNSHCNTIEINKGFSSGEELLAYLKVDTIPDLLILDIQLKTMDGYEVAGILKQTHPQLPILVLSAIDDEISIIRMVKLGVKGYLPKDVGLEKIEEAIQHIIQHQIHYTDYFTGKLIKIVKDNKIDFPALHLTDNENTFLKLACTELTYKEIADKMNLSFKTIDGYRAALFDKFEVKTRVGLALTAVKYRLVKI